MNTSVALRSSFSVGKDGAILILRSRGSIIPSLRLRPRADLKFPDLPVERRLDQLELRSHDRCVQLHMLPHIRDVAEEAHMPQLIQLIMSDCLDHHILLDIAEILAGCCEGRKT